MARLGGQSNEKEARSTDFTRRSECLSRNSRFTLPALRFRR
jgi:hypothetical protein